MQETKLLQTIDKLKTTATEANREARVAKTLQKLAAPKRWQLANGKQVAVQTPLTARARELAQLYHGLRLPLVSLEERLDVLLHVKWTVKEFDCALTRELVDLVRSLTREDMITKHQFALCRPGAPKSPGACALAVVLVRADARARRPGAPEFCGACALAVDSGE